MNLVKKFQNMALPLKATIAFGIASFAVSGINYITTPVFTRILSTTDYGTIAVYNSWFSIIQVFATLTLVYPGILQVGLYEHSNNRWKYLSSVLGCISTVTCGLIVLSAIFHTFVASTLHLDYDLILLMLLTCLFQSATTLWMTKHRYEYDYKRATLVTVGSAILAQVVSIIAVLIAKSDSWESLAPVRLWSAGGVNIIVGIFLYIYIVTKGKAVVDTTLWKATLIVALPLIPHYLSSVVMSSTDKIMIENMVGKSEAGIYSLVAVLAAIGVLCWRALSTTFSPFINSRLGQEKFYEINDNILPILRFVACTCFLGSLVAPELILLLATKEYLPGVYAVPPTVVSTYLHALYSVFSAIEFFHKKTTRIMIASVVSAALNIILNYVFIKQFGYIAAGYTTLVSNLVLTGLHYYNMRIIESRKIYDSRRMFAITIILLIGSLACNLLYVVNNIIRYIVVAFAITMIVKQIRPVVKAISAMKI
ncbi:lipopolysaccharide biosynthesis protein [[Clostridium] aminophilum]|uniref:lipopolysaccharide biosynthesis protein n=1 Tax=[Clostridium] aminophilum TaxID=1526 RepID=UPI003F9A60CD